MIDKATLSNTHCNVLRSWHKSLGGARIFRVSELSCTDTGLALGKRITPSLSLFTHRSSPQTEPNFCFAFVAQHPRADDTPNALTNFKAGNKKRGIAIRATEAVRRLQCRMCGGRALADQGQRREQAERLQLIPRSISA